MKLINGMTFRLNDKHHSAKVFKIHTNTYNNEVMISWINDENIKQDSYNYSKSRILELFEDGEWVLENRWLRKLKLEKICSK